jgi:tRNA(His) guanylyltransferase
VPVKADEFESRMRALEWFHSLRFPAGSWVILRFDGRGFTRLTESRFEKPFDESFHQFMTQAAQALLEQFQGVYAHTHSDEISLLLPRRWELYDRELEKTLSLSAAVASATFSLACGTPAAFDCRACLAAEDEQVSDYFRWRQADAARCALNGWCYWTLRKAGAGVAEATKALQGKNVAFKNELLFQRGINFNDVPHWQRRGTGLYWRQEPHVGHDPVSDRAVPTTRRRVRVDRELPLGEGYAALIGSLLRQRVLDADAG